jgi:hypothetical protein
MLKRGVSAHAVNLMLGHDGHVGEAHYTNALQIASAVKYA